MLNIMPFIHLRKIGVKCENNYCSILAATLLLGEDKTMTIHQHKSKRIDAQYYIKVEQRIKIRSMLKEAKLFVSFFDKIVSELSESEVKIHREHLLKNK